MTHLEKSDVTTIKDVALAAGVSIATVSRVLNGTRYVSPDLRERVVSAMQTLGYQPNAIAQGLRRQASHTAGLLVPRINEPFFAQFAFALEKTFFASGYRTLVCSTEENPDKEREYVTILLGQQVDAVVSFPSIAGTDEAVARLVERAVPVVVVERQLTGFDVSQVLVTNFQGAYDGVRHLVDLGHRRIGVICASVMNIPPDRLRGARQAVADLCPGAEIRVIDNLPDFKSGYEAALDMLRATPRPTAIFALTDSMAVGALHAAAELGLRVPADLSLVGFDDIPLVSFLIPPLTTVAQPIYAMGEAAARILLEQLAGSGEGPQTVLLETTLVRRASTAPPR
ncbi:MAG: LacI family DNA-binding transcriptional regulator [Chloroflexota bacterium]